MHKFRTMHWQPAGQGPVITAVADARILPFGAFLRKSKIDELPQFFDVLRGDMSIVGPRPEDPKIVAQHYTPWMRETLSVKPGITSPGALWGYTKMEALLQGGDPERAYVEKVLPFKLALEYVYAKRHNWRYDLGLIWRTAVIVVQIVSGKKDFDDPPEAATIPQLLKDITI
jgi:lipopolysaccharide/colanic/teichoic acid biosynthesis glycosyltransferase